MILQVPSHNLSGRPASSSGAGKQEVLMERLLSLRIIIRGGMFPTNIISTLFSPAKLLKVCKQLDLPVTFVLY